MQSIRQTIQAKGKDLLNIYFTAGHPTLESTVDIICTLSDRGVDLIEIGMPYSDPLADGPTIQASSDIALKNGQSLSNIFNDIKASRQQTQVPIMLMGYFNQLLQYGVERFVKNAHDAGVNGLIIPDLPMDNFEKNYKKLLEDYSMEMCFLITPMTSDERIRQADRLSSGFLYVVSQSSITGKTSGFNDDQIVYFNKVKSMKLQSPQLLGFGIYDKSTRDIANQYFNGCIIGSAFIRALDSKAGNVSEAVDELLKGLS
jgi:tryptophan synthase alpha chain